MAAALDLCFEYAYKCLYNQEISETVPNEIYNVDLSFPFSYSLGAPATVCSQETPREAGMNAFQAGDYTKAIDLLKKAAKSKDADAKIWSVLGLAYLKKGKGKDAAKAMNKAVEMEPKNDVYVAGLAVVYLVYGDSRANKTAYTALEINPKSIDGHYVLGTIALQAGSYLSAYQRANRIIELKPDFAPAYGLRSQALVGSYSAYVGVVDKAPEKKYELLIEAASDLEKFLELTP